MASSARGSSGLPARRPLLGLLLVAVGLLFGGSMLSSPPWPGTGPLLGLPLDACGMVGRMTSGVILGFFGLPIAVAFLLTVFVIGLRALARHPRRPWFLLAWALLATFALSVSLAIVSRAPYWGEGPSAASRWLQGSEMLGPFGAAVVSFAVLSCLLLFGVPRIIPSPIARASAALARGMAERAWEIGAASSERMKESAAALIDGWQNRRERAALEKRERASSMERKRARGKSGSPEMATDEPRRNRHGSSDEEDAPESDPDSEEADEATSEKALHDLFGYRGSTLATKRAGTAPRIAEPERERMRLRPRPKGNGPYALPPLELLEEPKPQIGTVSREEVMEKSRILVQTLADFGIEGRIGEVHPGPVITQYEYEPAAGVRISQIVSRADDIALALRAARIRIVAPIPGKAAIGIEVPNHTAEHIYFRAVVQEIDHGDAQLPLCLGRDIRGRPQFGRLEKMPHLLVAGTTGAGKSVCLNTCIFSLLYNRTPEDLRFLMIDPKMLELTVYDGIPHLLCPVVTDARMAARMLEWMVGEMERRYRKMAAFGVRNIEGYKEKVREKKIATEGLEPMPYVVVVVDELADLMLTLGREIETPIARLAQMARAVGIHLILATQRPSVDVITGVIKANFPARIAFQVASKVDSRTILDTNGAESLLGKGDMLYLAPGRGEPIRLHGAFVSDRDAEQLVEYLRKQPTPEAIFREEMLDEEAATEEIDDELFEDALRLVVMQEQASVSFLQRRLKIGYSRAGRLMDLLERARAVGAHEGSKPREVLADERFLQEWLARQKERAESGA